MSTPFYDLASLVVVPSGYKSGKIYAQKPLTTDGQLTFTRASTATRVNASGLIETMSSGVPRLDYHGSTCPKLLLEPQRTNLLVYSDTFSPTWNLQVCALTQNAGISPDGTNNAVLTYPTADTSIAAPNQFITVTASTVYTQSIYVKAAGKNIVALYDLTGSNGTSMWVNLTTGAITNGNLGTSRFATNVGNGWWRIGFTQTSSGTTAYMHVYPCDAVGSNAVTKNGTDGVLIWGSQIEQGSYATSKITTTSAAVTRVADMSGTTNYFGAQTFAGNFTFFVDLLPMEGNTGISDAMILGGGDYNGGGNYQSYFRFASGNIILKGVAEVGIIDRSYTMTANQQYKILVTRTGTTVKIFANGAQVGASATSSATVILRSLGWSYIQANYNYDGRINQVLLMPSGLTDAQAIELTTL